jgi:hypothetical protein
MKTSTTSRQIEDLSSTGGMDGGHQDCRNMVPVNQWSLPSCRTTACLPVLPVFPGPERGQLATGERYIRMHHPPLCPGQD